MRRSFSQARYEVIGSESDVARTTRWILGSSADFFADHTVLRRRRAQAQTNGRHDTSYRCCAGGSQLPSRSPRHYPSPGRTSASPVTSCGTRLPPQLSNADPCTSARHAWERAAPVSQRHSPSTLFSEEPTMRPRVTPDNLSTGLMTVSARRSSHRMSPWKGRRRSCGVAALARGGAT